MKPILPTLVFILFIFFFTTIGREISNFLRANNLLNLSINMAFLLSFILITLYALKKTVQPDLVSRISFLLLIAGFITLLEQLPFPEEKFHFIEFGILAILLKRSLFPLSSKPLQLILALSITTIFGILDEVYQYYLPNRVFDWRDMGINALAGFLALIGYEIIHNDLKIFRLNRFIKK